MISLYNDYLMCHSGESVKLLDSNIAARVELARSHIQCVRVGMLGIIIIPLQLATDIDSVMLGHPHICGDNA